MVMMEKVFLLVITFVCTAFANDTTEQTTGHFSTTEETIVTTPVPKRPSVPRNFIASGYTFNSFILAWNEPAEWNGDAIGYDLSVDVEDASEVFSLRIRGKNNFKFRVTNLIPEANYTVSLRAVSQASGQELTSDTVSLRAQTSEARPPSKVKNLRLVSRSATYMTVAWDQPEQWNGAGEGYKVVLSGLNITTYYVSGKDKTSFTFSTNSEAYATYIYAFIKFNGERKFGEPATLYTPAYTKRAPTPPRNFRILSQYTKTAVLGWDQPSNWNGESGGYVINFSEEEGSNVSVVLKSEDNTRFFSSELKPDHHYKFTLCAFNVIDGTQKYSDTVELDVRTFPPERPAKPENLKVVSVDSTSVDLTWDKVTGVSVAAYQVNYVTTIAAKKDVVYENKIRLTSLQPWTYYLISVSSFKYDKKKPVYSEAALISFQTNYSVPSPPASPTAVEVQGTSITLKWNAPLLPNGPVQGYIISWSDVSGRVNTTTTIKRSQTFVGLKPWTGYDFNITAYNSLSHPAMISEPISYSTKTEVSAPGTVEALTIFDVKSTDLKVKWKIPKTTNGPLSGYRVIYENTETGEQRNVTVSETNCTLSGLKAWTTYNISVEAYNTLQGDVHSNIYGPAVMITQLTKVDSPSAPTNLQSRNVTNSSIEITWEAPDEPNGPISGYLVQILNDTQGIDVVNDTHVTLPNLRPWTNYTIAILAFNMDGTFHRGGPQATTEERTSASAPPYASEKLSVASTDKVSASLKFPTHLFSNDNGAILEYVLLVSASKSKDDTQDQGFESLNETSFPNWEESKDTEKWYRSSHENWDIDSDKSICSSEGDSRKCVIGSEKACDTKQRYCDAPLKSDTQYRAKIRAYTVAGWTDTFPVSFKTDGNGAVSSAISATILLFSTVIMFNL